MEVMHRETWKPVSEYLALNHETASALSKSSVSARMAVPELVSALSKVRGCRVEVDVGTGML